MLAVRAARVVLLALLGLHAATAATAGSATGADAASRRRAAAASSHQEARQGTCQAYLPASGTATGHPCDFQAQEYLQGAWVHRPPGCAVREGGQLEQLAYPFQQLCDSGKVLCHVYGPNDCPKKTPAIANWVWQTEQCRLGEFDADALQRKFRNKKIAFIGDSIHRQMYNSFKRLLRRVVVKDSWVDEYRRGGHLGIVRGQRFPFGKEVVTTQTGMQVANQGSGLVTNANSSSPLKLERTLLAPIKWADILVLNIGHHWQKHDKPFRRYAEMTQFVLRAIKRRFKGQAVIFRTSPPGNYNCRAAQQPLREAPIITPQQDRVFSWRMPALHEHAWQDSAEALGMRDMFHYLNVSFSVLRADAHPNWGLRLGQQWGSVPANNSKNYYVQDCLHWCLPGVPDTWNWLLYNLLMSL